MAAELLPILLVVTVLFGVSLIWRLTARYRLRCYRWADRVFHLEQRRQRRLGQPVQAIDVTGPRDRRLGPGPDTTSRPGQTVQTEKRP